MSLSTTLREKGLRLPLLLLGVVLPLAVVLSACDSQLEQESFSNITPENFFTTEQEFLSAASGVYAQLRSYNQDLTNLQAHTTDALMVPTRGTDWDDGGNWRALTRHEWTPSHPTPNAVWGTSQTGISRANGLLSSLRQSKLGEEQQAQFASEIRFLRAYFYYVQLDLFGNVPVVVENGNEVTLPSAEEPLPQQPVSSDSPPRQLNRKQVFTFILQELTGCTTQNFSVEGCVRDPSGGIIGDLPAENEVPHGRATKGAAYTLLARMLLNAEIYLGTVDGMDSFSPASEISNAQVFYEGASAAASQVLNSGQYSLAENHFDNFTVDNYNSPEVIFAATHKAEDGVGFQRQQAALHYNHPISVTPWNGFTTIADFYNSYNTEPGPDGEMGTQDDVHTDRRGKAFLAGKQYAEPSASCYGDNCFSDTTSTVLTVRGSDNELELTLDIPNIQLSGSSANQEEPGARPLKYEIDPNADGINRGNDFVIMRLAEVMLIKAEAENELGNMGMAQDLVLDVRSRAYADDAEVPGVNASSKLEMHKVIMEERAHELFYEGFRRQDLIRYEFAHGGDRSGVSNPTADSEPYAPTFTGPWLFKDASTAHRLLFPIPQGRISTNPNLDQNEGY